MKEDSLSAVIDDTLFKINMQRAPQSCNRTNETQEAVNTGISVLLVLCRIRGYLNRTQYRE